MSDLHKSSFGFCLPWQRILDDLIAKFVLNASEEERASDKCMFLVENAHWFYGHNLLEDDPTLKSMSLKDFTRLLFNNCDVFKPYATRIDEIVKNFASYKPRIPVNGAIILDDTYERVRQTPLDDTYDFQMKTNRPKGREQQTYIINFSVVLLHGCCLLT